MMVYDQVSDCSVERANGTRNPEMTIENVDWFG